MCSWLLELFLFFFTENCCSQQSGNSKREPNNTFLSLTPISQSFSTPPNHPPCEQCDLTVSALHWLVLVALV